MDEDLVRQRLAAAAETISGVTGYDWIPDDFTAPGFVVGDLVIDYLQTFGTDDDLVFLCRLLLDRSDADGKAPQRALTQYMRRSGPRSIKAALEAEPTLGGACDDLVVRNARGPRQYLVGTQSKIGAEFTVQVIGE